jgi:MoaA/NifB/PqqE/SkfB family radical SAM enzyme
VEGIIAVTYRCNAGCRTCGIWAHPSDPADEVTPRDLESLPRMSFACITGGEPFLRDDLEEIIAVLQRRAGRIVVNTNAYDTDRIIEIARQFPTIGYRASIEGLPVVNDQLRGLVNGFDHGMRTLLRLRSIGVKDIGFSTTISDANIDDVLALYELADAAGLEFATSVVHNGYYFHKDDNRIEDTDRAIAALHELSARLLRSRRPKNWFRAWFNMGLANRLEGGARPLPCRSASDVFFVDPYGELRPCNVMETSLGSLKTTSFDELWRSEAAARVRERVRACDEECWMIGTVSPAMKRNKLVPARWVARAKLTGTLPPVGDGAGPSRPGAA